MRTQYLRNRGCQYCKSVLGTDLSPAACITVVTVLLRLLMRCSDLLISWCRALQFTSHKTKDQLICRYNTKRRMPSSECFADPGLWQILMKRKHKARRGWGSNTRPQKAPRLQVPLQRQQPQLHDVLPRSWVPKAFSLLQCKPHSKHRFWRTDRRGEEEKEAALQVYITAHTFSPLVSTGGCHALGLTLFPSNSLCIIVYFLSKKLNGQTRM